MDEINDSIKQLNILVEDIKRQRKASLNSLLKAHSPEMRLKELRSFIDSIENLTQSSNHILNHERDSLTELKETVANLEQMKNSIMPMPIDYINGFTPTASQFMEVHNSINKTNWFEINKTLSQTISTFNHPFINILLQSDEFSKTLHEHIIKINDNELNEIFSMHFLRKITGDWWIFPRYSLEEYKEISKIKDIDSFNNFLLDEFYFNPSLIEELISNWNITNEYRETIIKQAYFNYIHGNYETCVILLMLQIEGLMKEKIDYEVKATDLRKRIQKALEQNSNNDDAWESFLNKANAEFIFRIVKPLYDHVDFEYNMGDIKRHEITHVGVVKATQKGAMRLFLILDTVIYILEDLDEI